MRHRAAALAALGILATGCSSLDQHRQTCAALLARPALDLEAVKGDAPNVPGGPQTAPAGAKPAPIDPQVEACAARRADSERQAAGAAVGVVLLTIAAAALGASSYRSSYRPAYRSTYRPTYRRR